MTWRRYGMGTFSIFYSDVTWALGPLNITSNSTVCSMFMRKLTTKKTAKLGIFVEIKTQLVASVFTSQKVSECGNRTHHGVMTSSCRGVFIFITFASVKTRESLTKTCLLYALVNQWPFNISYLVHNMSRSQLYLGFGHFGWLPSFFGQ